MSLRAKTISGVKWTGLSAGLKSILALVKISIISHYLTPQDFGLFAIVNVFIFFSSVFTDLGFSQAIIQKQDINEKQFSTIYWSNIILGSGIFIFLNLVSSFVANFYQQPELKNMFFIISFMFLIAPFGQQFKAILQKELNFNSIAKLEISTEIFSFIFTVILAINGFKVYALVHSALAYTILITILLIITGLKFYSPKLYFNIKELKDFFSFGAFHTIQSTIGYFNGQIDVLIIGKLLGTEALGIYNVVKQLTVRPKFILNPVISTVAFPVMSRVQDNVEELRKIYIKALNSLLTATVPIYLAMIILAKPIINIFLGDNWSNAIIPFQLLAAYTLLSTSTGLSGSLVYAVGKINREFIWNLSLTFVVPFTLYFASSWGIKGICAAFLISEFFYILPIYLLKIKDNINISFKDYMGNIAKPIFIGLVSAAPAFLASLYINNYFMQIFLVSIIGIVFYIAINYIFNRYYFKFFLDLILPQKT